MNLSQWCPKCEMYCFPRITLTGDAQIAQWRTAEYCGLCGTKVGEKPNTDIICPCGAANSRVYKFCQMCGLKLHKPNKPTQPRRGFLLRLFGRKR